jgi:hypothetical protein
MITLRRAESAKAIDSTANYFLVDQAPLKRPQLRGVANDFERLDSSARRRSSALRGILNLSPGGDGVPYPE